MIEVFLCLQDRKTLCRGDEDKENEKLASTSSAPLREIFYDCRQRMRCANLPM